MSEEHIGKMVKVDLRHLWEKEDRQFTPWLSKNLDRLSEKLGFNIKLVTEEGDVGSFSADIVAETENKELIVIENQLEQTDHTHLGQLLTYLSNLGAKVGIWISKNPRQEHINVIDWLNENAPEDTSFYLVRIEAYTIDSSKPAPLFTIMAGPS